VPQPGADPARPRFQVLAPSVTVTHVLAPEQPADDPRVQMNVRLPKSLRDAIDARRAVKDMSRDKWVENAVRYALSQHQAVVAMTNTQGRTAPPPHTR
jgi:hypothetical protein